MKRCLSCHYPLKRKKLKNGVWVCRYCKAEVKNET